MSQDTVLLVELKKLTAKLVQSKIKFDKLSQARQGMSMSTHTARRIEAADASLNWHAIEHDKLFREVHAVSVDCGLSAPRSNYDRIEYNPSSFHRYTHQPRIPICRKP